MNPSANTNDQQGDPSWTTENWDNPGAVGSLEQTSRQLYPASRLEWEWDPMILAENPGSASSNDGTDGDRKNQITAGTMSSLRAYNNMLATGLPSNFAQHPMGIFSSAGIRNFAAMHGSSSIPTSSPLHNLGSSGIPGLAASSGAGMHGDMRPSFEQRRREYYAAVVHDHHHVVKREEVSDGHGARIGLNLGVRTYFSTEDTAAGRLGKRHRANSPSSQIPMCQAEGCKADLSTAKHYHRRHKVCELHSKAPNVVAAGHTQRFCQQCSRFHLLTEFDEGKRSCRKRLADHNRRRRKPQPNVTAGTTAESMGMKDRTDDGDLSGINRATALHDDSDEKSGSAGNNLQLRTSGSTFGRGHCDDQRPTGMQMGSQAMTGSDAQALLSAMSLSPPNPLMLHNANRHLSMMSGGANHNQDATVYQQFLQGVGAGQTGPNLSLSSLGGHLGLGNQAGPRGQTSISQGYNGMEPPVPWLKPMGSRADLGQTVTRTGTMNLQQLMSSDSKNGQSSHQSVNSASANSSNSQDPDVQVFSPSNQNMLPLQSSSRDISSPEWMLGSLANSRDGSSHFGPSSSLSSLSGGGQLEGHQMLALLENSTIRPGDGPNPPSNASSASVPGSRAMEFLHHPNSRNETSGDTGTHTGTTGGCGPGWA